MERVHLIPYYDNERAFTADEGMGSAMISITHPYASWECGLNKNINGLIRQQYLPKPRGLTTVSYTEREQVRGLLTNSNHEAFWLTTSLLLNLGGC